MRLTAYLDNGRPTMGVVIGDLVSPLTTVQGFYEDVPGWLAEAAQTEEGTRPAAELTPAIPVPETAKVVCVALNYPMHAQETKNELPALPNLFARWWATLVADGEPIPVPDAEPGLDWEVELAVVIGSPLRAVAAADAAAGILGYTVFNDVSARTHQQATSQWANGKNADQSGPIASAIVTADELDPSDLRLWTQVNGEMMQDGRTSEMAIKIPELLEYATRTITLRPGDVVATGTPAGVGFRRQPPVLMHPGDVVEVGVEGIATVRNPIVDASHRH
ncbi:fumarylacetoacetate hydrolase family protein [Acidiferrimicrobium sp. IK]|uniref:fumarylacetoacetate hydrolase family protein n=1 Tax=Acidiferrimicrobium sp. IK TaxID=2871700 RepID=UPI0021CAE66B|nr:fumarylacetoacetate hydrolase family protein [Acidiferrimicrobium sp. IK]MCU4185435.1 fumarylacetoacetate hydrolase family protein [Acidiferrimicrobium sp. IK]